MPDLAMVIILVTRLSNDFSFYGGRRNPVDRAGFTPIALVKLTTKRDAAADTTYWTTTPLYGHLGSRVLGTILHNTATTTIIVVEELLCFCDTYWLSGWLGPEHTSV